ncbi:MAG: hypothetical protein ABIQ52_08825 [Vicinamibacterales bacterium]
MLSLSRLLLAVCLCAAVCNSAHAQSEPELRDFFEGKTVVVKLDMPATQEGVDIYPDARRIVDFNQYSARVKATGVAIRTGESVLITKIRVKDKLIEFQLAGGGFGTFGDDTGSVSAPTASKSRRERDLERLVKDETDRERQRRLQRELDDLRADRAREDSRNRATAATAEEAKKARIATTRLHSGSRFNIRYQEGVPPGLAADGVMRALANYVDFPFAGNRPAAQDRPAAAPDARDRRDARDQPMGAGAMRKGMSVAEVEQSLGRAEKTSSRMEGTLRVVTNTYSRGDQVVTADFVEGVLIKYAIASR